METEIPMKTVIAVSEAFGDRQAIQLNAIGHLCQSLAFQMQSRAQGKFILYRDAEGTELGALSWWPLVIVEGKASKVQRLWHDLKSGSITKAVFLDTMIAGGSDVQLAATRAVTVDAAGIIAVGVYGPADEVGLYTKKFSLWRHRQTVASSP